MILQIMQQLYSNCHSQTEFLKDKKCPGSSLCDTKMSRYVLPQICFLMSIFKQTSRYNTVQDEFHYKILDKMVQKLKLRYKSPDINAVCI